MAAPTVTSSLLSRRALYFQVIAATAGIVAGVLTYRTTLVPPSAIAPTAIAAGILGACCTLAWLLKMDWPTLAGWHGLGLLMVSSAFGAGMGALACWAGASLAGGIYTGVPLAAAALVALPKIAP